jgi:hypothetical protein
MPDPVTTSFMGRFSANIFLIIAVFHKWSGWFKTTVLLASGYALLMTVLIALSAHAQQSLEPNSDFGISLLLAFLNLPGTFFVQLNAGWNEFARFFAGELGNLVVIFCMCLLIAKGFSKHRQEQVLPLSLITLTVIAIVMGGAQFYFIGPYSSRCERFQVQFMKNSCFYEVARDWKGISLCEKISENAEKDACRRSLQRFQ